MFPLGLWKTIGAAAAFESPFDEEATPDGIATSPTATIRTSRLTQPSLVPPLPAVNGPDSHEACGNAPLDRQVRGRETGERHPAPSGDGGTAPGNSSCRSTSPASKEARMNNVLRNYT
jgi:hypothetical protein